jgi:hypothetical protein
MKLKTTPIEIMKALIAAHVKKNRNDDEAATMLAIKPMLVETFGEVGAESLLGDRTGKDYYYHRKSQTTPQKWKSNDAHLLPRQEKPRNPLGFPRSG